MNPSNQRDPTPGNGQTGAIVRVPAQRAGDGYGVDLFAGPIAAPEPPPTFDFRAIWRFRWSMLIVFLVLAPILVLVVRLRVQPMYDSTATMHVAAVVPRVIYKTDDNGKIPLYSAYLNTQVSLIQSPEVLLRVLEREDVRQTDWFRNSSLAESGDLTAGVERLARQLAVQPRRGTELIDITLETLDPRESQIIVNAVAEEYKRYWDQFEQDTEQRRLATLRTQREQLDQEIKALFDERYRMSEELGSNVHEQVRAQRLSRLNAMKADLDSQRATREVGEFGRSSSDPASPTADGDALARATGGRRDVPAILSTNETWQKQFAAFEDAKRRLALVQSQYGTGHPTYQSAAADVENAERVLRLTEARLLPGGYSPADGDAIAIKREEQLVASINKLQAEVTAVDHLVNDLAKTGERYNERNNVRKELIDRLHALEMERNAPARLSLRSAGMLRRKPSSDRRMIYSMCAIAASILVAVGIGFLRSRIDSKIHAYADISGAVPQGVPFLGQLPRARDALGEPDDTLLGRAINENMRIVRTMMLRRLDANKGTVVVTSPEASAGKTTVSILMARSLARMGKRVLLVDCDTLHPSVSQYFELGDRVGLRSVMAGDVEDSDAICPTHEDNLFVLPAGSRYGPVNRDVLANGSFTVAVDRWEAGYDFVLMDSPPALAMADARIAAGLADGVIMVLRADGSRREDAVESFAGLAACGAKLLGTMLVGVRTGTAYYPYHYQQQHASPAELLA